MATPWAEREMLVIQGAVRMLGRSLDPGPAIREILHLASEFLGLNRGRVALWDAARGALAIRYSYGLTRAQARAGVFAPGEGITGHVFQSGEAVVVQDVDAEPRFLFRSVPREQLPQETVAYIALPVLRESKVVGVLGVHRLRRRDRGLAEDLRLLGILVALVGQLLELEHHVAARTAALERENRALKEELERAGSYAHACGIIGEAPALLTALRQIERVADTDATMLLLGESGTGKELVARALHMMSRRRDGPFVKLNCAALPEPLFEAELFGHEKGAYTGAAGARAGKFELADGGTLFLDEIGEMPLALQAKLLRALAERVVERLGGHRERPVDVRIVAATNQDLQARVDAGLFRLDLFYRLNVVPVTLPPLRRRRDDIPTLVRHFLHRFNQQHQRAVNLSPAAIGRLIDYGWPGNVRQLQNVIERIVLMQRGAVTLDGVAVNEALASEPAATGLRESGPAHASPMPPASTPSPRRTRAYRYVDSDDRARIEAALQETGGNKSAAAQRLGLSLRQLQYRLQVLASN
ncbi:MAG: sigma-54-dependent Fis family transcriptional regulator [Lautropia sp. SCN 66-9]|nr:MAG: sigma-54-dependent Fis family transcriptional regulator [Lautropia sp. SCN 66-9]